MQKQLLRIASVALFFCMGCSDKAGKKSSGMINAGTFQVYYERVGKGDALLFLHAGFQDHTMWEDQVKEFSKDHEVITIDLPYHGQTKGDDTTLYAADLIRIVLDSLQIKKVSIAGLSMGASSAQDFVVAYPERVNKAIFMASGINGYYTNHPIDSISMMWWPKFQAAMDGRDTAEAAAVFTRAWAEGIYREGDSLKSPVSKYVYENTLKNLKLHKADGWPLLRNDPPVIDKLGSIKTPVLVIHGDKDLPHMMETNTYLANNIPGAKRVLMKDVAHMLNMEKVEEVNKLIRDFLKN